MSMALDIWLQDTLLTSPVLGFTIRNRAAKSAQGGSAMPLGASLVPVLGCSVDPIDEESLGASVGALTVISLNASAPFVTQGPNPKGAQVTGQASETGLPFCREAWQTKGPKLSGWESM